MGRKRRRRIPIVLIVALILCLGMVIFCGSQLAGIFLEYKEGTDEYDDLRKYVEEELPEVAYGEREDADIGEEGERRLRIDLEALRSENKDVVGWIEIPDTEISYPLMQGDDDAYYLKHTFSGNTNSAGSIFIEALNSPDFTDLHTIIYGHNMKNGSMFADLHKYEDRAFFDANPYVYVYMPEKTLKYHIFAATPFDDRYLLGSYNFSDQMEFEEYLDELRSTINGNVNMDVNV